MEEPVAVVVASRWEALRLGLVAGLDPQHFTLRRVRGFWVRAFLVATLSPMLWLPGFETVCLTVPAEQHPAPIQVPPLSPDAQSLRDLLLSPAPDVRAQGMELSAVLPIIHPIQAWLWTDHAERRRG
jgi:hypothetical protein